MLMRNDAVGAGDDGPMNRPNKQIADRTEYLKENLEILSEQVNAGFILSSSFEKGYSITLANEVLLYEADGQYYRWTGDLPKDVPANSTPASTGGFGGGAWVLVGDGALRSQLASDSGVELVNGAANLNATSNKFADGQLRIGTNQISSQTTADRDTILIARNIQKKSDRHAFRDESTLNNIDDYGGYGSVDVAVTFNGNNNFDHQFSFQDRFTFNGTGTLKQNSGLYSSPTVKNGTVTTRYGALIRDVSVFDGASVTEQQAINIKPLTAASRNYAIVSEGKNTKSIHGGGVSFGYPLGLVGDNEGVAYVGYELTGAVQYGIVSRGYGNSSATYSYSAIKASAGAAVSDSEYTIPHVYAIQVVDGGVGTNASIGDSTGLFINAIKSGKKNYGINSIMNNTTGGDYNILAWGDAANTFSGNTGFGSNTEALKPSARVYVQGGTTEVPSIQIGQGKLLTEPAHGSLEFDGVNLWFTIGSVRKKIQLV